MYPVTLLRGLGSEVWSVVGARSETHRHLRDRIAAAALASVVVDVVAAVAVLLVERHAQGTAVRTYGQALFWTSSQLLTVSSSAPNPLTPAGRAIDVGLELWAITVVTAMAGSFGAFFHMRSRERRGRS
jgi:drug/metabolite transporter (DMT)-like permease